NCFEICPRHALHAKTLGFTHPLSGMEMNFESPLPNDMAQLVDRWRSYTAGRRMA
ncbi:MAG TPA: RNA pseudouridine synthase, partial [Tenuifilaceae bacterium]|nr:RNA pseudouridine synthase [Tenuifilaceae bacterium]